MSKKHKYSVIDLFAGAGGFGLGFQLTGKYEIICSLERDTWAIKTLKTNSDNAQCIIEADIRDYQYPKTIKEICNGEPTIIIGGPPCQGFSNAGPADKKDPDDPRNTLFVDFAKWVDVFSPEIFVMENVTGLLSRKNTNGEKVLDIILKTFEDLGYLVNLWLLNAAEYGVPQLRERVFLVGNKRGEKLAPPEKTHILRNGQSSKHNMTNGNLNPAITVGQAIWDLPKINAGEGEEEQAYTRIPRNNFQRWARSKDGVIYNHIAMKHTTRIVERFKHIQNGISLKEIPKEYSVRKRNGNGEISKVEYNSNYRHLQSDKISYTIPASFYSSFIHPYIPRNITAREAARLQSFPDWYKFEGKRTVISSKLLEKLGKHDDNYLSQYNQIGNAVPPLLGKSIGNHLCKYLDDLHL